MFAGSAAATRSHVEISFAVYAQSNIATAFESIRATAAASLGVPPSSVTVTVLNDGKVSVAISDTTLTASQKQAALQRLQRGLIDGSSNGFDVTLAGFTVTGANMTSSGILFLLEYILL